MLALATTAILVLAFVALAGGAAFVAYKLFQGQR